ncbi:MAG: hypothetical protein JWL68_373 [Actinomycetia bacterium]|jgi:hypothetical protein|nr:hypothetical protein [Actinomycetes bacterium]
MRTAEAGGAFRAIGGSGVCPGTQSAPPGQQGDPAGVPPERGPQNPEGQS